MGVVNFSGTSIEANEIVAFLKQEVHLRELCHRILCQQIVRQAAQERNIEVTAEEIQIEADQQRRQRRLESATATFAWLKEELITPEDWEAGIRIHLLRQKLAQTLFEHEVEKYFAEHRLDFEQVYLYKLTVPYKQLSQELFYQIEENEISFYEAAHLYDIDKRRRSHCGYEGCFYRWSLNPEVASIVFGARIGEVLGPLQSDQGFDLLMVEEITTAELGPETQQEIINQMFNEWLDGELNYILHNH